MGENSLLSKWKLKKKKGGVVKRITKAPENVAIPLSKSQQRLWFLQQLHPKSSVYNYAEIYTFNGSLVVTALKKSLQSIYEENDVLRTYYVLEEGVPRQKVTNNAVLPIAEHDFSNLSINQLEIKKKEIFDADTKTYFDLDKNPLVRVSLIKTAEKEHILLITMHHIITDKWSMGIFREILSKKYKDATLGNGINFEQMDVQYADYAYHQKENGIDLDQLEYWKKKLSGDIPVLNLPLDNQPVSKHSFAGGSHTQQFSGELSKKIVELSKELEVTPYVLLLSVYYALLHKLSGQEDIWVGSPISNRNEPVLENMIGFFDETIVLRKTVDSSKQFSTFVSEVKQNTLEAFSNKDVPFDALVKELNPERKLGQNPFFRSMFIYHAVPETPSFGTDLKLSYAFFDNGVSKFDLTFYVALEDGLISSSFEYATDLFKESTITRLQGYVKHLLEQIVDTPDKALSELEIVNSKEKEFLLPKERKEKGHYSSYNAIHDIIFKNVSEKSSEEAVVYDNVSITYKTLGEKAERLSRAILMRTEGRNEIVGLCAERSIDMIVGILAILKVGCAYLPIDPDYPTDRIDFMTSDAGVKLVLSQKKLASLFKNLKGETIFIENSQNDGAFHGQLHFPSVKRSDLAYVIYTSGSTGKPKGVPITHGNIINSTEGRLDFYPNNPGAFLLLSSIAFDSSKAGIFWTLCTGGKLVVAEKRIEQDLVRIGELIAKNRITHTLMLPSLYQLILDHVDVTTLQSLETVMVAGEACLPSVCEMHFSKLPQTLLFNEYGPTEATVWCIAHQMQKDVAYQRVPIGNGVAGAEIYLLSETMELVPFGTKGELYIGGSGLSGKYINRPDLTEKAYVPNPFSDNPEEVLYKTGDLGQYNALEQIEFFGRADRQIKIRGHRVELNEIETILSASPMVKEAVVSFKDKNGPARLTAYVEVNDSYDKEGLNSFIVERLPNYMRPNSILIIDEMPRLPNGKVDKKQLDSLSSTIAPKKEIPAHGLSQMEKDLLSIWREVLQIDALQVTDNFFEIGGDSIMSIQIVAKAREKGILFPANQLFESQNIAELALFATTSDDKKLNTGIELGEFELTPIQHWFFEQHKKAPHFWNQGYKIKGVQISELQLESMARGLAEQYDTLRLNFEKTEENIVAFYDTNEKRSYCHFFDISDKPDEDKDSFISEKLYEIQDTTDLASEALFNCIYFDTGVKEENSLFFIAHHLIVDVVSWNLILNTVKRHINSFGTTGSVSLEDKTISYKEWSSYLSQHVKSLKGELNFWQDQLSYEPKIPIDYNEYGDHPIYEKDISTFEFDIDSATTSKLLKDANQAYSTTIDELLTLCLADCIASWSKEEKVLLSLERHGRESINSDMDFSNTVGWFTSFFPVLFEFPAEFTLQQRIITVKEKLRKIAHGGIGYGLLRYLAKEKGLEGDPKIVFNYLGIWNESPDRVVAFMTEGLRHDLSERNYLFEINTRIQDGKLKSAIGYSKKIHGQKTVAQFASRFKEKLHEVVAHCMESETIKYTPSDFPDAGLNQDDLDALLGSIE
ncbi:MAG: amino acid adenylation domain-containing protein [Bacteroidota bacterium]